MELAASLLTSIYQLYQDSQNPTIKQKIKVRSGPFPNFLYTIDPSLLLETRFTPLKMGLVYCHILDGVIKQLRWPRHMLARIIDETEWNFKKKEIGILQIDNSPTAEGAVAATTPSIVPLPQQNGGANGGLVMPVTREKRWLLRITKPLFSFLQHPDHGSVSDDTHFNLYNYPASYD
ncbi:MAG: hypothetical protein Q9225_003544 [Loekoesia sp. 1 TL-2023]